MRFLIIFLTFILILMACAAPTQPTAVSTDLRAPESHGVVIDGTFETSLLVTEWKGTSEGNILFPLDPASRTALPGYTPISLGQSSFHAFSPDRRTLAVVSFPSDSTYNGSLLLIDLSAWRTQRFELGLIGWVSAMVFSPDGNQLAIAHGETNHKLTIFDLEQGVITAQSQMDSFIPQLKFTESGEALMLYSPAINTTNGLTTGSPRIILLDAADLSRRWSATLEDVHDGIFPKDENVTSASLHEPGQALFLSPGLVFAPDRDALYVVHADSGQLTTVDFESRKVETVEIRAQLSWFEQILSFTAGVAHAKISDGTNKQIAISPDGQFLYVIGVSNTSYQDQQGNWQMEQTPLGMEIILTSDGGRVEHVETDATELSLSPDGRFLYLRNWERTTPWTEIFNTASRQVMARKSRIFAMPAFLMNNEFLLVSTYSTSETVHYMSVLAPDGSSVLSEWTDSEYIWWLTTP
jgi:WD40 repeat protein